jgi:glutaredoxin 2
MMKVKCPLFVQMTLPEFGLKYTVKRSGDKPEAFVPTVDQVYAQNLEASQAIQADIAQTTAALLLNPSAYQMEHCDTFISQVISPISVYNVLIVNGSLVQWLDYLAQQGLPAPIEAYRKAIEGIFFAEYPMLKDKLADEQKRKRP